MTAFYLEGRSLDSGIVERNSLCPSLETFYGIDSDIEQSNASNDC